MEFTGLLLLVPHCGQVKDPLSQALDQKTIQTMGCQRRAAP